MDKYVVQEDAPHTEKFNEHVEGQTAQKAEFYTKEEVQRLLELLKKEIKQ